MKLNSKLCTKLNKSRSKFVIVTKYHDTETTQSILDAAKSQKNFLALGENRLPAIKEKNISPEQVHFIGPLQSNKIKQIAENVSAIHSLSEIRHAEVLNQCEKIPDLFIQINISEEPQKSGILPDNFSTFYTQLCKDFPQLPIIGISAIGRNDFTLHEKCEEFRRLKEIRDKYMPAGKISAGTSVDYAYAIAAGIDIVRIGRAFVVE